MFVKHTKIEKIIVGKLCMCYTKSNIVCWMQGGIRNKQQFIGVETKQIFEISYH